jgi:antitoxin MazE
MYLLCRYGGFLKTQVQKWGNSLALRIPKAFAADLGLTQDTTVELSLEDGNLVIRPSSIDRYELASLLTRVTEANLHGEQNYGEAVGSEEW